MLRISSRIWDDRTAPQVITFQPHYQRRARSGDQYRPQRTNVRSVRCDRPDDRCGFLGGDGLTLSNGIKTRVGVLERQTLNVIISTTPDGGRDAPDYPGTLRSALFWRWRLSVWPASLQRQRATKCRRSTPTRFRQGGRFEGVARSLPGGDCDTSCRPGSWRCGSSQARWEN